MKLRQEMWALILFWALFLYGVNNTQSPFKANGDSYPENASYMMSYKEHNRKSTMHSHFLRLNTAKGFTMYTPSLHLQFGIRCIRSSKQET